MRRMRKARTSDRAITRGVKQWQAMQAGRWDDVPLTRTDRRRVLGNDGWPDRIDPQITRDGRVNKYAPDNTTLKEREEARLRERQQKFWAIVAPPAPTRTVVYSKADGVYYVKPPPGDEQTVDVSEMYYLDDDGNPMVTYDIKARVDPALVMDVPGPIEVVPQGQPVTSMTIPEGATITAEGVERMVEALQGESGRLYGIRFVGPQIDPPQVVLAMLEGKTNLEAPWLEVTNVVISKPDAWLDALLGLMDDPDWVSRLDPAVLASTRELIKAEWERRKIERGRQGGGDSVAANTKKLDELLVEGFTKDFRGVLEDVLGEMYDRGPGNTLSWARSRREETGTWPILDSAVEQRYILLATFKQMVDRGQCSREDALAILKKAPSHRDYVVILTTGLGFSDSVFVDIPDTLFQETITEEELDHWLDLYERNKPIPGALGNSKQIGEVVEAVPRLIKEVVRLQDLLAVSLAIYPCHIAGHGKIHAEGKMCTQQASSNLYELMEVLGLKQEDIPRRLHSQPCTCHTEKKWEDWLADGTWPGSAEPEEAEVVVPKDYRQVRREIGEEIERRSTSLRDAQAVQEGVAQRGLKAELRADIGADDVQQRAYDIELANTLRQQQLDAAEAQNMARARQDDMAARKAAEEEEARASLRGRALDTALKEALGVDRSSGGSLDAALGRVANLPEAKRNAFWKSFAGLWNGKDDDGDQ